MCGSIRVSVAKGDNKNLGRKSSFLGVHAMFHISHFIYPCVKLVGKIVTEY